MKKRGEREGVIEVRDAFTRLRDYAQATGRFTLRQPMQRFDEISLKRFK